MSLQLASAILRGKWLIDPQFALSQGSVVSSILNRTDEAENKEPELMSAFAIESADPVHGVRYSYYNGFDKAPANSVAVISLHGALMKNDQFCGASGMATIGKIIKDAEAHHNIAAIVLHIDSPGGTVDGTEVLANIIKNTTIPVVSFVDGLMASAALWIGSSADEIIASTDTDEIGSVGVLMSFMDVQGYYEKKGVKFHTITATTSPDKVKMWEELREGKYENYIKDILDPLDEKFMSVIRENLPNVQDEHLSGKVFFARDVMNVFVNSIGSLEDAILRAAELASTTSGLNSNSDTNSNSNTYSMKQFAKINSALGVESLESVDESVSLNEQQLQVIETGLEAVDTVKGELKTSQDDLAAATTAKTTAENELNTAIAAFDEIDDSIANAETATEKASAIRALLAAKPGSAPEGAKTKDANLEKDDAWATIDALPHNQNVD